MSIAVPVRAANSLCERLRSCRGRTDWPGPDLFAQNAGFAPKAATMNLHEYQAKDLFRSYGIPVPAGKVASSPEEALEAAHGLGGTVWVVKAQVHAGGRGKAGGVKVAQEI